MFSGCDISNYVALYVPLKNEFFFNMLNSFGKWYFLSVPIPNSRNTS